MPFLLRSCFYQRLKYFYALQSLKCKVAARFAGKKIGICYKFLMDNREKRLGVSVTVVAGSKSGY